MSDRGLRILLCTILGAGLFVIGVALRFNAPSFLGDCTLYPDVGWERYENQHEYEAAIDISHFLMVAGGALGLVVAWSVLARREGT